MTSASRVLYFTSALAPNLRVASRTAATIAYQPSMKIKGVREYPGKFDLLLHGLFTLIRRHAFHPIGLLGLRLDLILRDLAKADLLIDHVDKQQ